MLGTALVIMTRCPEKGKVKTRLARSIGEEATLQLYQAFLVDLATRFTCGPQDLYWAYTPVESDFEASLASLLPAEVPSGRALPQQGEDLGERLHHVFLRLSQHYQHTIVIASDSPHVSQKIIDQAAQALTFADIVLGPAEDGGYYLIAMRTAHDVFRDIPMSTSSVLRMTIEKARCQGLTVHLLEPLFDVDELADLQRLARMLQEESLLAPVTAASIASSMKELVW
ncbi:MAG: TIGR04282 family arsenosugar biosynthesis glycosyltransferase [Ktedonobacteraceae bacterium]|nr:TIGR04282 family arsenosugar biosynthesis glycosyltransferase [Ktedonobacteraceae bacterium]